MNKKLELVVPIVNNDVSVFLKNLEYIKKNIDIEKVVIIGAKEVGKLLTKIKTDSLIMFINEDTLYPGLNLEKVKNLKLKVSGNDKRSGWYFQQFLKMAYSTICEKEYYLIWDSDTIPVTKLEFYDCNGKPYLAYRDYVKFDECFFRTQKKLLPNNDLEKKCKQSYITEHMLVKTEIMKELLTKLCKNNNGAFYEKIFQSIEARDINLSGFSEFEAYAAYVLKYHPSIYIQRKWKNLRNAKIFINNRINDDKINWISEMFDVISIEKFDRQWLFCRLIIYFKLYKIIKFSSVYIFLKPLIDIMEEIRQFLRNIIKK